MPSNVTVLGEPNFSFECTHSPNACLEASLDLELMQSMASGAETSFLGMDPNKESWFADYITALANEPVPSLVNSISYTVEESTEQVDWKQRFGLEAQKLAARGVTLVAASGDDGVAGYTARAVGKAGCAFNPAYPASNPFVLTIGPRTGTPIALLCELSSCGF